MCHVWFNYYSTRFKIATHGTYYIYRHIKVRFDLFLNNLLSFHVNILKRMANIDAHSQQCKHFINIYVREHNNVHLDNITSRSERKHCSFYPFKRRKNIKLYVRQQREKRITFDPFIQSFLFSSV